MSQVTLIAKPTQQPVDCRGLTPTALQGLSYAAILKQPLSLGGQVGDAFEVVMSEVGDALPTVIFEQTTHLHHAIGFEMSAGQLIVRQQAGDFLAGNMQGGILICHGNTGDRVADRMRRGICLVEGEVKAFAGANMQAGTLGILGACGDYLGYGMKRGSLLLATPPKPQATWVDCGSHTLPFLNLFYLSLRPYKTAFANLDRHHAQRWMGDMGGLGKAEMLWLLPNR